MRRRRRSVHGCAGRMRKVRDGDGSSSNTWSLAVERGLKTDTRAREPAVDFYLRLGYRDLGPSYLLFGLIPHRKMETTIPSLKNQRAF